MATAGTAENIAPSHQPRITPMSPDEACRDVFISYNHRHQRIVRDICNGLEGEGIPCWMDERTMRAGDDLYRNIARGLNGCTLIVACVTAAYTRSEICRKEVKLAYDLKKTIIPVLIESVEWPLKEEMGLIFAGQLYLDMSDSLNELRSWTGDKVRQLVGNIKEHLSDAGRPSSHQPHVKPESPVKGGQQQGVKLLIFYRSDDFALVSRSEIQHRGQYPWTNWSHIKCQIPGMVAGMTRFEVVRDALRPLFRGEIRTIEQRRCIVGEREVPEITSRVDEVENGKEKMLWWWLIIRAGDEVLIRPRRRTVLWIFS